MTTWSLVTVVADGEPFVAARVGGGSLREVPALKGWASLTELVDGWPAAAFRYDWFASKARDGSLPLGPGLTPAWLVPDPHNLRIRLWVNDELQQDGSTADMICDIPTLVAAASQAVTLEPGDVISTGTPAGVGAGRGVSLRPGDVVRTEIEHLGVLVNRIVAADSPVHAHRPRNPPRPRLEEP